MRPQSVQKKIYWLHVKYNTDFMCVRVWAQTIFFSYHKLSAYENFHWIINERIRIVVLRAARASSVFRCWNVGFLVFFFRGWFVIFVLMCVDGASFGVERFFGVDGDVWVRWGLDVLWRFCVLFEGFVFWFLVLCEILWKVFLRDYWLIWKHLYCLWRQLLWMNFIKEIDSLL